MGLKGFIWHHELTKILKSTVTQLLPSDNIWDRSWDILIVLDGCRADLFTETIDKCETVFSHGSTSRTWIRRFFDRDVSGAGYVTGNGHINEISRNEFAYFHIEETDETEYGIKTVPPSPLVDHTIHAWRNRDSYDLNRLVVHFMQPHAPFRSRPEWFESQHRDDGISAFVWQRLKQGEFEKKEVWDAYRDNLNWVWDEAVSILVENLDADIAVTADHGNAFGEHGFYGHPMGCPIEEVREVPWYTLEGQDTCTHKPQVGKESDSIDREQHLRALGYR